MLLPQGYGHKFGPKLIQMISDPAIRQIDISTAWVRGSGVRHIRPALVEFLARGGSLTAVVGIDRDNTSEEGLRALTSLATPGIAVAPVLWVRHNEGGFIFHPKLYAFRSAEKCDVFVGSNNLTQAGLFQNEELSVHLVGPRNGPLETSLIRYMGQVSDPAQNFARPLTDQFIDTLMERGYVSSEAILSGKSLARERRTRRSDPLFGSRRVGAPPPPEGELDDDDIEPVFTNAPENWSRIFLKLTLARGTQAQVPKSVVRALRSKAGLQPMDGPLPVTVRGEDRPQFINPTYAENRPPGPNTYKFEAFAAEGDAILKMEIVGNDIFVEVMDSAEPVGAAVLAFIEAGEAMDPVQTIRTRKTGNATLYRFA